MTHFRFGILAVISFLIFETGCSISKRHYRKGYHITWQNHKQNNLKKSSVQSVTATDTAPTMNSTDRGSENLKFINATQLSASNNVEPNFKFITNKPGYFISNNDSCADILVFRDGVELTVKIVEVYEGTVKYLPCNNLDGPLRVQTGEKVFMIKYANGTREVLQMPVKSEPDKNLSKEKNQTDKKGINGLALASFICGILGFLILPAIVAVILGMIAKRQYRSNPTKYKAMWMATFGMTAGMVWLGIYFLSTL